MGEAIKWVAIGLVAVFLVNWLRNGINLSAQASPNGPGMLYAPGSSWQSFLSPYAMAPGGNSFFANYGSGNRGFSFGGAF